VRDELTVIRGRVDLLAAASAVYQGRLEFSCEFDEFTTDTPLNRLIKAAARAVAASPLLDWPPRRRALALMARMDEVGELRRGDEAVPLERRTGHYRDAAQLGRHVLRNQGRVFAHGEAIAWTFLIPTPMIVEEGVRVTLKEGLVDRWEVQKKGIQLVGSKLTFTPDLVFGDRLAVSDVKYKLLGAEWNRVDLYQALAFATAYRTTRAAIVGFRVPAITPLPSLHVGDTDVAELTWVADPEQEPDVVAAALVEATEQWLDSLAPPSCAAAVA
jgi:5-methylcytosine-specific restriction endonuclease McrBC regulatory subunit McrC